MFFILNYHRSNDSANIRIKRETPKKYKNEVINKMKDSNLIPQNERTKDEQRKIARQGGVASGVARREKKRLAEALRDVLNEKAGSNSELTKGEAIIIKMVQNVFNNPTADDVLKLQKILGEDVTKVDFAGAMFKIETTLQNKDNLDKI